MAKRLIRGISPLFIFLAAASFLILPVTRSYPDTQQEIADLTKQLETKPDDVETLLKIAERYGWINASDKAIETYEKVLAVDPNNVKAVRALKDFYGWTNKPEKSIAMMEKLAALEPADTKTQQDLGQQYMWAGKTGEAKAVYEKIIAAEPGNLEARRKLADLYSWSNAPDKALEQYAEIVKLDPNDLDTKEKLAFNYMWSNRMPEAEQLFKEVVEKDPTRVNARKAMADIYYWTSRQSEAITQYLQVANMMQKDKDKQGVYRNLGDAYASTSAYDKARDYYRQLVRMDPMNLAAQRRLDEIERLMKPQFFTQADFLREQGTCRRFVTTDGVSASMADGWRVMAQYLMNRRTTSYDDRYVKQTGEFEVSKDFGSWALFSGFSWRYYSIHDNCGLDYYARLFKVFNPKLTGFVTYRKQTEDDTQDILNQRVDRHSVIGGGYYSFGDYYALSATTTINYETKGNTSTDNIGVIVYASPIIHLVKVPLVDLSYNYYRVSYLHSLEYNPNEPGFQYYSPGNSETHSITLYAMHDVIKDKVRLSASESLAYTTDDDSMRNDVFVEAKVRLTLDDDVIFRYYNSKMIRHITDTYNEVEQFTVRYSRYF